MEGLALGDLGQLQRAQAALEQCLALYDPAVHRPDKLGGSFYGQDAKVVCLSYIGFMLWCRGYPDQAQVRSQGSCCMGPGNSTPF